MEQHPEYKSIAPKWKKMRDASASEDEVKEAGDEYLSRLPSMSAQVGDAPAEIAARNRNWQAYLRGAFYQGATGRTLEGYYGRTLRKAPSRELPKRVESWAIDVDGTGTSLNSWVTSAFREFLRTCRLTVAVDQDSTRSDPMPRLRLYSAESLQNWVGSQGAGLDMLAFEEVHHKTTATIGATLELKTEEEKRSRILHLADGRYTVSVYDDKNQLISTYLPGRGDGLSYIPAVVINSHDLGTTPSQPVAYGLACANLAHYALTADLRRGITFGASPIVWATGWSFADDDSPVLEPGSSMAWTHPNKDAKCGFAEYGGAVIPHIMALLSKYEAYMVLLGAQPFEPTRPNNVAAETMGIAREGETSALAGVVNNFSSGITRILEIVAEWLGASGKVRYELNTDFFDSEVDPSALQALVAGWQQSAIPIDDVLRYLQKREVSPGDRTVEEHLALINAYAPTLDVVRGQQ